MTLLLLHRDLEVFESMFQGAELAPRVLSRLLQSVPRSAIQVMSMAVVIGPIVIGSPASKKTPCLALARHLF